MNYDGPNRSSTNPTGSDPCHRRPHLFDFVLRSRLTGLGTGIVFSLMMLLLFGPLAKDVFDEEASRFDSQANTFLHSLYTGWLDRVIQLLSTLGSRPVLVGLLITTVAWLYARHQRREALVLTIVPTGGALLSGALKLAVYRPRSALPWSPAAATFSFPSEHAMSSLTCYLGLAVDVWMVKGVPAAVLATLIALSIGVSRIYLEYHHLSDVLGGYSAGPFWLAAISLVFEARRSQRARLRAGRTGVTQPNYVRSARVELCRTVRHDEPLTRDA